MDNKKVLKLQIIGFFVICIIGTLLHFVFELSGNNIYLSIFVPINESVWEHLKLGTFATIIFMMYEHIIIGDKPNYVTAKFFSIITQILTILLIYYTYTSVIGKHIIYIDILSFILAISLGQIVSYKILTNKYINETIHIILLFELLIFLFVLFTFIPPKLDIFKDPQTNKYGLEKGKYNAKNII
ncbi:MAG: DUF6512 family protein [Clostridia bacterium]